MRKTSALLGLIMAAALNHAAPASAQVGAAITRTQTNATVAAIEREVREAAQPDRQKQAQSAAEQAAAAPQPETTTRQR